jgi:hypothetical protein
MSMDRSGEHVAICETTLALAMTAKSRIHCWPDRFVVQRAMSGEPGIRGILGYNSWPGVPDVRSSTRIEPVANTSRKSPVPSARW